MTIYTMGFAQKDAQTFFNLISKNNIEILIDVRLNNRSQLAGFTKGKDLAYFLKEICHCEYSHMLGFAPTKQILDGYKKGTIDWKEYTVQYDALIKERKAEKLFEKSFGKYERVLFLCSEPTPEMCHRRLLAEYMQECLGCDIRHI